MNDDAADAVLGLLGLAAEGPAAHKHALQHTNTAQRNLNIPTSASPAPARPIVPLKRKLAHHAQSHSPSPAPTIPNVPMPMSRHPSLALHTPTGQYTTLSHHRSPFSPFTSTSAASPAKPTFHTHINPHTPFADHPSGPGTPMDVVKGSPFTTLNGTVGSATTTTTVNAFAVNGTSTTPAGDETSPDDADGEIHCICSLTYDDGFSIACDTCSRWCHAACFDISKDEVPEEWHCWVCVPRPVDRERALRIQRLRQMQMLEANAAAGAALGAGLGPGVGAGSVGGGKGKEGGKESQRARKKSPGVERKPRSRVNGAAAVAAANTGLLDGAPGASVASGPSNGGASAAAKRKQRRISVPVTAAAQAGGPHSAPPGGANGMSSHLPFSVNGLAANGYVHAGGEDEMVDVGGEPWTHAYVPISRDVIPQAETRDRLRRQAQHWRGVSALTPPPGSFPPSTSTSTPPSSLPPSSSGASFPPSSSSSYFSYQPPSSSNNSNTAPVFLPSSSAPPSALHPLPSTSSSSLITPTPHHSAILPPSYTFHTATPLPASSFIARYPSTITPSSAYLADPLNAYAHMGLPKPHVHLLGPPLDVALDARGRGGRARWVRSGCRPNAVVRPFLCEPGSRRGKGKSEREESAPAEEDGESEKEREKEKSKNKEREASAADNGKEGQGGGDSNGEESDEDTLAFGVFALRDLKAGEEVVLGWEWDDGNAVHQLPALVESPHLFAPAHVHHLRQQFGTILHTLGSTFTTCACGAAARDCVLNVMSAFVDGKPIHHFPRRAPPSTQTPGRTPSHDGRMNGAADDGEDHVTPRAARGGAVDLGPLVGAERGFRTRERVPFSGGLAGVEMVRSGNENGDDCVSASASASSSNKGVYVYAEAGPSRSPSGSRTLEREDSDVVTVGGGRGAARETDKKGKGKARDDVAMLDGEDAGVDAGVGKRSKRRKSSHTPDHDPSPSSLGQHGDAMQVDPDPPDEAGEVELKVPPRMRKRWKTAPGGPSSSLSFHEWRSPASDGSTPTRRARTPDAVGTGAGVRRDAAAERRGKSLDADGAGMGMDVDDAKPPSQSAHTHVHDRDYNREMPPPPLPARLDPTTVSSASPEAQVQTPRVVRSRGDVMSLAMIAPQYHRHSPTYSEAPRSAPAQAQAQGHQTHSPQGLVQAQMQPHSRRAEVHSPSTHFSKLSLATPTPVTPTVGTGSGSPLGAGSYFPPLAHDVLHHDALMRRSSSGLSICSVPEPEPEAEAGSVPESPADVQEQHQPSEQEPEPEPEQAPEQEPAASEPDSQPEPVVEQVEVHEDSPASPPPGARGEETEDEYGVEEVEGGERREEEEGEVPEEGETTPRVRFADVPMVQEDEPEHREDEEDRMDVDPDAHLEETTPPRAASPVLPKHSPPPTSVTDPDVQMRRSPSPSPVPAMTELPCDSTSQPTSPPAHVSPPRRSPTPPREATPREPTPPPAPHEPTPPREPTPPPKAPTPPPPKVKMSLKDFALRKKKQREMAKEREMHGSGSEEGAVASSDVVNAHVVKVNGAPNGSDANGQDQEQQQQPQERNVEKQSVESGTLNGKVNGSGEANGGDGQAEMGDAPVPPAAPAPAPATPTATVSATDMDTSEDSKPVLPVPTPVPVQKPKSSSPISVRPSPPVSRSAPKPSPAPVSPAKLNAAPSLASRIYPAKHDIPPHLELKREKEKSLPNGRITTFEAKKELLDETIPLAFRASEVRDSAEADRKVSFPPPEPPPSISACASNGSSTSSTSLVGEPLSRKVSREEGEILNNTPSKPASSGHPTATATGSSYVPRSHTPPTQPRSFSAIPAAPTSSTSSGPPPASPALSAASSGAPRRAPPPSAPSSFSNMGNARPPSGPRALRAAGHGGHPHAMASGPGSGLGPGGGGPGSGGPAHGPGYRGYGGGGGPGGGPGGGFIPRGPSADRDRERDRMEWERENRERWAARSARGRAGSGSGWGR